MQSILLAGLEDATGEIIKTELEGNEYETTAVKNIEELLLLCERDNNIDMILIDVKFAAHEVSQLLKDVRDICNKDTRIVMTGEYSHLAMSLAVVAGFDDFIARPFGKDEVKALLKGNKKQNE